MRKIFSLAMIALLLGVGLVAIIETDPGYLLLAYGNYTLESSLWVGLLLLFLFTALLYFLVAMLRRLLSGQKLLSGWLDSRRSRKATRLTNLGLVHYIEGNWSKARQEPLKARYGRLPVRCAVADPPASSPAARSCRYGLQPVRRETRYGR